jgi:Leucine-rich repeat (LRR) protein
LDKNYPKEQRKNITNLDINKQKLEGDLALEDFDNLVEFDCRENKLTALKTGGCQQLSIIDCANNQLTTLKVDSPCL